MVYATRVIDAVSRASGFLFYVVGALALTAYALVHRGIAVAGTQTFLHVIDLPLLFIGALFAGSSLYKSLTRADRVSIPLLCGIAIPLAAFFFLLTYFNFAFPVKTF